MTTQPKVSIGEASANYTQQHEGYIDDDFYLGDLSSWSMTSVTATLTSISSFTHRRGHGCCAMRRSLSGQRLPTTYSVKFRRFGLDSPVCSTAPRLKRDRRKNCALSSKREGRTIEWLGGRISSRHVGRHYGQDLPTPGYDALNAHYRSMAGMLRPRHRCATSRWGPNPVGLVDTPFYSDLGYRLNQYAGISAKLPGHVTKPMGRDRRSPLLQVQRDTHPELRWPCSPAMARWAVGGSVDSGRGVPPRAILSFKFNEGCAIQRPGCRRAFRLGGINDPINLPLCSAQEQDRVWRPRQLEGRDFQEL